MQIPVFSKSRVLVVDDNEINLELLETQLKPEGYEILKAIDGQQALDVTFKEKPDIILLDVMMPKKNGFEVCQEIKNHEETRMIPIVIITALKGKDEKLKAIEAGADDFINKPFNRLELLARVRSLLRIKVLIDDLDSSQSIIVALAKALEASDQYTKGHSDRVGRTGVMLGRELGLSEIEQANILKGGYLHDIGKIGCNKNILNKPGPLTSEEYDHVLQHPVIGYEICKSCKSLDSMLSMIRSHHERIDGKGRPDGLKGEKISVEARIISIVDTYDAMTSDRPYRKGMDKEKAYEIFKKEFKFGQWDTEILSVLLKMIEDNRV